MLIYKSCEKGWGASLVIFVRRVGLHGLSKSRSLLDGLFKSLSLPISLEIGVHLEAHRRSVLTNRRLGVSAYTLLEEVILILQAHVLHEGEGI